MDEPSEVFTRLNIDFNVLVCAVARINLKECREVVSLRHWQLSQCRLLLLLSGPETLVCPDSSFLEEIIIVAPQQVKLKGILESLAREANLELTDQEVTLTPEIVESTLKFSLVARLYPYWNLAVQEESTDVLVHGARFLTDSSNSPVDAIKLRVFAKADEQEIWIGVRACRLRLPIIRPEYLDISFNYIDKMLSSPGRVIDQSKIGDPLVYVLPSLERGRINFIMNGLPLDTEFTSYKHMQQHWKDTFGFILPGIQSNEPLLVACVKHEKTGGSFLYPVRCLLKTAPVPVILKHDDQWALIKSVLKKIKSLVQIRFLAVNPNHFLSANQQLKKQLQVTETVVVSGASNESNRTESNNDFVFKKPRESGTQDRRYRLSLKRQKDDPLELSEKKTPKVRLVSPTGSSHATPRKRNTPKALPSERPDNQDRTELNHPEDVYPQSQDKMTESDDETVEEQERQSENESAEEQENTDSEDEMTEEQENADSEDEMTEEQYHPEYQDRATVDQDLPESRQDQTEVQDHREQRQDHSENPHHSKHLNREEDPNNSKHPNHSKHPDHSKHSDRKEHPDHSKHSDRKEHPDHSKHPKREEHPDHSKHHDRKEHPDHSKHPKREEHPDHSKHHDRKEHPDHSKHPDRKEHPDHSKHPKREEHPDHSKHPSRKEHPDHSKHPKREEHPDHSKHPDRKEQPKRCKKMRGRRLWPGESIEEMFEKGKLDKVMMEDLVVWLHSKKIHTRVAGQSKETLLSLVRSALTNVSAV